MAISLPDLLNQEAIRHAFHWNYNHQQGYHLTHQANYHAKHANLLHLPLLHAHFTENSANLLASLVNLLHFLFHSLLHRAPRSLGPTDPFSFHSQFSAISPSLISFELRSLLRLVHSSRRDLFSAARIRIGARLSPIPNIVRPSVVEGGASGRGLPSQPRQNDLAEGWERSDPPKEGGLPPVILLQGGRVWTLVNPSPPIVPPSPLDFSPPHFGGH